MRYSGNFFTCIIFKLKKPQLWCLGQYLTFWNSCQIQVGEDIFWTPLVAEKWVDVQIHAVDSSCLGFWRGAKMSFPDFCRRSCSAGYCLRLWESSCDVPAHCEFQRGCGEPSLLLRASIKIIWPQGISPAVLGEMSSHQLLTWGCQVYHWTSVQLLLLQSRQDSKENQEKNYFHLLQPYCPH